MHKKGMKRKWKTFIVKEKMSGLSKCMENIYGQIDSLRCGKSFFFFFRYQDSLATEVYQRRVGM